MVNFANFVIIEMRRLQRCSGLKRKGAIEIHSTMKADIEVKCKLVFAPKLKITVYLFNYQDFI